MYKELLESAVEFHNRLHRDEGQYNIVHTPDMTIVKGKFVFKELGYDVEMRCNNIIKTLLYSWLRNYRIDKTLS